MNGNMTEEIPDKHLFMICEKLNEDACRELPAGFHVRHCTKDELDLWKAMIFDTPELAAEYYDFMTRFYHDVYAKKGDLFFRKCLFVCNESDTPVGTCFIWKAYNKFNAIHWLKVRKAYEGKGIGRALLSILMRELSKEDYPVFLHTHPSSYRAIKLYTDFGFCLLSDPVIGTRSNHLDECLPILKKYMPEHVFNSLKITKAPDFFLNAVQCSDVEEF